MLGRIGLLFIGLVFFRVHAMREVTVEYFRSNDTILSAQLWLPDTGHRIPAILLFHEGGFVRGDKYCFSEYADYFTSKGFAAMGVEYRLMQNNGGYPNTVKDAIRSFEWLSCHAREYNVDSTRIILLGSSAGAYLAAMVCASRDLVKRNPEDFQGVKITSALPCGIILSYGIYNWETSFWKGDGFVEKRDWKKASPVNYLFSGKGKYLIFAGKHDQLFGTIQAEELNTILKRAGCETEILIRNTGGHSGICYREGELAKWEAGPIDSFLNTYKKGK